MPTTVTVTDSALCVSNTVTVTVTDSALCVLNTVTATVTDYCILVCLVGIRVSVESESS